ncbi:ATP-binding protein [Alicyclobacillus dauci]|uniref:histidine kinase n=1 Tax=Alicyclobacillus dauci TaxID=1475485 RepID=A0ABY6Z6V0_9BACL|nr:ATP-binding protein [Alicyclobacillus dauci]WAH38470.1 ATP-binding protein [Alicyclobacillus dauci]
MQQVQIQTIMTLQTPFVFAAANQLKQVFINVLKNAIESMPNGGNVYVSVENTEDTVVVRIQDEGPGIRQEWLNRLGEPFYTTKEKGTGLGLMVSYNIVKDHNGEIRVSSSPTTGTCIEIVLPTAHNSHVPETTMLSEPSS